MQKLEFKVDGMTCSQCENTIKTAVGHITGVSGVDVSISEKTVTVSYDPSVINDLKIRQTLEHEGYNVVS